VELPLNNAVEETCFSFSRETPKPPERRGQKRHMTILRVGTIHLADRRELCLIRNISAGGLMAHVYSRLVLGERVAAELKTNQRIEGSVGWIEGSNVGITFDAPIDVEEILNNQTELDNGWRPRLPRVEVDRLATLRVGAELFGVSTRNISQGGVAVETDHALEPGQEVVLSLDKFRPLHGTVRWYQHGICGIAFNHVVPFRELMDWLQAK
jgi:hypothetical protein